MSSQEKIDYVVFISNDKFSSNFLSKLKTKAELLKKLILSILTNFNKYPMKLMRSLVFTMEKVFIKEKMHFHG